MGNDNSSLSGLELDDKAVEVTDFWAHHSATIASGNSVSVFIGEPFVSGSLWLTQTPLEKATKNLMLYRHPCILKYISSWHKGSKFYLALEDVKPLSLVLSSQNTLEICIGLYSILKAICFLHEKAHVSHNNICIASIYVTKDGNWKLGGMEYLCRFVDLSEEYLCKTRVHRYDKAIDTNESKIDKKSKPDAIDCYAFAVLVNDVLQKGTNDDVLSLCEFLELCRSRLQNTDIKLRPKLSTLLEHEFFTHDFISVHSFLTELPLKSEETKAEFFASLSDKLRTFNESMVGNHLGALLLSRIVLLDKNAQQYLLPNILCPRYVLGGIEESNGLFTTDNFKQYLVPRLLQIFCVRDAQIRLLLLEHFNHYMKCFSVDELQLQILPELLVGIKDTNDHLVAVTLRALADIVPILGAATVIGGQRGKLFNDGRPIQHKTLKLNKSETLSHSIPAIMNQISSINVIEIDQLNLPERPRPDGEEGETSTGDIEQSVEDDMEQWDVWDLNDNGTNSAENNSTTTITNASSEESTISTSDTTDSINVTLMPHYTSSTNIIHKKKLIDISELDIKTQVTSSSKHDEYNFFQDMEPVIQTTPKFLLSHDNEKKHSKLNYTEKLSIAGVEDHVEGWGDSDWE